MAMIKFEISPFDVLFFGDGKPFNMGGTAKSMALPMPHTVAGAITSKLKAILGESKEINTSIMAIYGPFLQHGDKLYLPKPANILRPRKGEVSSTLGQGKGKNSNILEQRKSDTSKQGKGKDSNILKVSLPETGFNLIKVKNTNIHNVETLPFYIGPDKVEGYDGFISLDSLREFIKSDMASKDNINVKGIGQFILDEPRVGISIGKNGIVEEDGLYRAWFKRPKDDVKLVVWVKFREDLNERIMEAIPEKGVLKLGGESRMAHYVRREDNFLDLFKDFPKCSSEKVKCNLMFLTPGILGGWNPFGKVYSASIPGYMTVPINVSHNGLRHTVVRAIPPGSIFWGVDLDLSEETRIGFLYKNSGKLNLVSGYEAFARFIGANLVIIWPYHNEKKEGKDAK